MMEEKVRAILAKVFELDESSIGDDFGPQTVEKWDSAGHMRLIMALEEAFDVMFEDDDVEALVSVAAIAEKLKALQE